MGKTIDLFKKIRDIKGTFHVRLGTIKDRNGKDLTEAEEIKKRWQENTGELYKKGLNDPDNHDGVVTQPRARHPGVGTQEAILQTKLVEVTEFQLSCLKSWASLIAQLVKNLPAMQETLVRFLGWEELLEKGQATHSSIFGLPLWLSW